MLQSCFQVTKIVWEGFKKKMKYRIENCHQKARTHDGKFFVNTTLYELVQAVNDEVPSADDYIVATIVDDILNVSAVAHVTGTPVVNHFMGG